MFLNTILHNSCFSVHIIPKKCIFKVLLISVVDIPNTT